jgi:hypothetical protein
LHPTESSALNDSDLLSGWLSYVRTDYRDSLNNESHQPTISIPNNWDYPRFSFSQRTQQGVIVGMEYYLTNSQLAYQYGQGWRYAVMHHDDCEEIRHYFDDQIQTLSLAELRAQIIAEIDEHTQQIDALKQQLAAVTGGRVDD